MCRFSNCLMKYVTQRCIGSAVTGGMGVPLPQNESQGMQNRGSFTPTTAENLDMIQVIE